MGLKDTRLIRSATALKFSPLKTTKKINLFRSLVNILLTAPSINFKNIDVNKYTFYMCVINLDKITQRGTVSATNRKMELG